jgi:hypothetical protein
MSEWIRAEGRFPAYGLEVLITYFNSDCGPFVCAAMYREDSGWEDMSENDLNHLRVTHWMPLPEPPK